MNSSRIQTYKPVLTDALSNVFKQTLPGSTLHVELSREYSQNGNRIGREYGGEVVLCSIVSQAIGA